MSTNINLLVHADGETLEQNKRKKLLNIIAFSLLLGVGLISFGVMMLTQAINIKSIKNEQQSILRKISKNQSKQAKLYIANNRVENIEKIMEVREIVSKVTNGLLEKIPSELVIDNFEIGEKSVVIMGTSKSLLVVGEFIDKLTDMVRKKDIIKSLTLTSLALDLGSGSYKISVKTEL
jgi:hypothetical protein